MANFDDWDKTTPLNTDAVSLGDDQLRSFKSSMQAWWEEEHFGTDGSAASSGVHALGSARCYQSSGAPSLTDPGRLWHDTDDNSFWVSDPTASSWVQVSSALGVGSTNTFTVRQHWETSAATAISVWRPSDTNYRFEISRDGIMNWGSGSGNADTNLYRDGVNQLKTDDTFFAAGLTLDSGQITGLTSISGANSVSTINPDINFGSTPKTSIYSTGGIFMEGIPAAPVLPSLDSHGVLFIDNSNTNYELAIRWGDGTTDVIASGPAV